MPAVFSYLSTENPVFTSYLFYSSLLVLKVLFMAPLTARQRFRKKVVATKEDTAFNSKELKVKYDDPDVERVRRAHLNDLENIPVFLFVSLGYILTNPDPLVAVNLFRAFTIGRFMHTFVYAVCVVPQPARGVAWGVGYFTTIYMAVKTAIHFA